jgi:mono/diheme cytochrome c family protein
MKLKILLSLAVFAVLIQFVPYGQSTNPPVLAEPAWDSPDTRQLFFRACADCHSNETKWPWYSRIAPIAWLVRYDVDEGREHLNVSAWGKQRKNEGSEAAKAVREGEMPPWQYLLPHPEARLSDTEQAALVRGLVATFGDKRSDRKHD